MVSDVKAEDRLLFLEHRVEELSRSLANLEKSFSTLTAARPVALPAAPAEVAPAPPAPEIPLEASLPGGFTLVGRTLLAFGGAYLLRTLTAAGFLPEIAGAVLAFLYALVWLGLADRDGGRGRSASAGFHGATAVLIGLPLLWETTVRFHALTPALGAVAVALFSAAVFAVAWRRHLPGIAWLIGLGAVAAAFALIAGTHVWAPFTVDLILLGLAGLWLAYTRSWRGLGWLLGFAASGGVLLLILVARLAPRESGVVPAVAVSLALALCLVWLASFAVRLLAQKHEVTALEAVLSVLAFCVGYGGAALLAAGAPETVARLAGVLVGALGCALSLACYVAAFGAIERAQRRKLLLASSLALAFLLAGSWLLLPSPALAPVWAALAVVAAAGSLLLTRVTLALHGTLYALSAALASGLVASAGYAFAAPAAAVWPALTLPALLALAAAVVECVLPVPRPAPFWKPYASATRLVQLLTFTIGAGAAVLYLLAPAVAGAPPAADAGLLAAVRTFVLVAAALLLGWLGRWERFREAGWLVYPLLVLACLKLLVEDFPQGRPATLFVALALCGGAFIAAPRVMKRKG